MKENKFSITIKPKEGEKGLLSLTGKWNAEITVNVIKSSKITEGPISYSAIDVNKIKLGEQITETDKVFAY